jgi:hypothetical protein
MAKISFGDIIALAKQGYKPADIKELMALDIPETPEAPETEATAEVPADPEVSDDTATAAKATAQPAEDNKDAEIEALRAKVSELQKTNQTVNQSGNEPDPQKDLDDIVRSFM